MISLQGTRRRSGCGFLGGDSPREDIPRVWGDKGGERPPTMLTKDTGT